VTLLDIYMSCTVYFTAETASRHSRLSLSQLCLSLLIIVVSVFEDDLSGFIYTIRKPLLLCVNDTSWCFPFLFHQTVVVHRLCLVALVCSPAIVDWDL